MLARKQQRHFRHLRSCGATTPKLIASTMWNCDRAAPGNVRPGANGELVDPNIRVAAYVVQSACPASRLSVPASSSAPEAKRTLACDDQARPMGYLTVSPISERCTS